MKLYFAPGACSLSPHIVLREAGQKFDLVQVDLKEKKTKDGNDFNQINGKGQVPTLETDDGFTLTEGPAIVQYAGDKNPGSKVVPAAGTQERYQVQEWLNFITSELHKNFGPLFRPTTPDAYKAIAKEAIAGVGSMGSMRTMAISIAATSLVKRCCTCRMMNPHSVIGLSLYGQ